MADRGLVDALYERFDAFTPSQENRTKQLETVAELWTRLLGKVAPIGPSRSRSLARMREAMFWASEAIRLEKEGI